MTQPYAPHYFRLKAKIWLALAGLLAILWLVLWLNTDTKINLAIKEKQKSKEMVIPTKLDNFVDFRTEVPPISFDTITKDLRNYPDEFKDKTYFEHHEKKWTVQVMDVAEHKIILDYLDGHPDRKKFAYFRYADQNNKTRYLLTYGVMSTFQEAMGAAKLVDFRLPKGVRVLPEEMKRYVAMIDNYQRSTATKKPQTQAIKLQETSVEVPAAPASTTTEETTTHSTENQENTENTSNNAPKKQKTPAEQFEESKRLALAEMQAKEAAQLAEMERRSHQTQKKSQDAIRQLSEHQAYEQKQKTPSETIEDTPDEY